jgi:Cu/Ag efflux protein CusF
VKRFWGNKRFNLGEPCVFTFVEKDDRGINGLRIGQKVTVMYRDANGVLVASRLTQEPLRHSGTVKSLDASSGKLVVGGKTFRLADGCTVVLRNEHSGSLTDVKLGHFVTVWYEEPPGGLVARRIAQTSRTFVGSLTAIDLSERTIKAKSALDTKTFHLADNCSIRVNGEPAQMKDLKPGEEIEFSYDEVNGVNVATRIAPEHGQESVKP